MKPFLFLLLLVPTLAWSQKQGREPAPDWSIQFYFDHISFPLFGKYRPIQSVKHKGYFFRSWRVSAGKTLASFSGAKSSWTASLHLGYLHNHSLQKGILGHLQFGNSLHGMNYEGVFVQPALDAGGLLLLDRGKALAKNKLFATTLRLQWTAGLSMDGGYRLFNRPLSPAFSYRLWLQGPFIRRHAAALPHQSFGLAIYQ